MSTTRPSSSTHRAATSTDSYSGGAVGVIIFAAVIMILTGVMQALQGVIALANDTFFVVGQEYVFEFDVTSWGWIHLILGVIVACAGVALFQGATWARTVAVMVAAVAVLVNFAWIPFYPIWSLTLISFSIAVIWAVTAHGRDVLAD